MKIYYLLSFIISLKSNYGMENFELKAFELAQVIEELIQKNSYLKQLPSPLQLELQKYLYGQCEICKRLEYNKESHTTHENENSTY